MGSLHSYMVDFPKHGDERGWLVVVEGLKDIPFEIARVFYIYGSDSTVIRGQHANKESEFILVNVCGSCKVKVIESDLSSTIYSISHPHQGLYLPNMVWKEMYDFSEDSILLCLASQKYDPDEYIRDYNEYLDILKGKDNEDIL